MYEDAYEILDYLPVDRAGLAEYIDHLWGSFETLIDQDYPVRPFSLFPFHLLSMLAIQYKVFRISAYKKDEYIDCLGRCRIKNRDDLKRLQLNIPILDQTTRQIPPDISVRNLSLLHERSLFSFLEIVGVEPEIIVSAKQMVDLRGTYAHANGNIEQNLEEKIDAYLDIHRSIQKNFLPLNDEIATRWLEEMGAGESGKEYIDVHLASEFLTPSDMNQGKLATLDKRLNGEI